MTQELLSPLIVVFALTVSMVTLVNTSFGLAILIFSMLLSPELEIAGLPQHAVVVRVDDILLFAVFFTWLAKLALFKRGSLFKKTPLNGPIALFIVCCILSTLIGLMLREVQGKGAFFFLLKYVEYFLLYSMFTNVIEDKDQLKFFLKCALFTCFVICLYTFSRYGKEERVSAPFEGEVGEPASLGGYLLFMMGVVLGLWIHADTKLEKFAFGLLLIFLPPALAITTSRGSFLGVLPLYVTVLFLTRKKRVLLFFFLLISPLLVYLLVPPRIIQFTLEGFHGDSVQIGGTTFQMGYSGTSRVFLWKNAFQELKKNPITGMGITGVGLVDNQYIRFLGETGFLGFSAFLWLLFRIFAMSLQAFRLSQDDLSKGLALGFIGGFVGLLALGMSANSFIIVRIMEPFWFVAAAVSVLPQLSEPSNTAPRRVP